ncbi:DVU_1553 family AMP-dependent CoA ligase [Pseudodesulfovibrio indicus]|uniref:AMP-dependent synthetase n=1 Tax=Pseudodesulfovibrio indicus TaxID=1716143 RepID=A0A126QQQ7_9BACT|nr:AMP-binding protein [Pseudodesulfovibrio indicus]AMK12078.1 AMP-dependent synthetase [Pseudodesulfovibrio indicus]TDT88678.1 phenylacetate-coenzyme A ligase PaaK-like adenylate-forming protein [Pseudodesulfovibrio indicus]
MALPFPDLWLSRRMGLADGAIPSRAEFEAWLADRLAELVDHARANSPFYARHLDGFDGASLRSLDDFSKLPMITPDLLGAAPERLLCVSQDEIARVVTLTSSGTTGIPKRVFHTGEDLAATTEFFSRGMANMLGAGETALVFLPGERPGGVGRLLDEALSRFGARAETFGPLEDADAALDRCLDLGATCVVGSPAHLNLLALAYARRGPTHGPIRSALLCWDTVPDAVVRNVAGIPGCRPFRHWGMIETGLGGGVECAPGSGMHLREADVYVEIADQDTGRLLPDGEFGEMVVTTPLRRGMPLIRYRTGDVGRILAGECVCGSPLKRLDPQVRRVGDGVELGAGVLRLDELNELLYGLPGVGDFAARFDPRFEARRATNRLSLTICGQVEREDVFAALRTLPGVAASLDCGALELEIQLRDGRRPAIPGLGKRRLDTGSER